MTTAKRWTLRVTRPESGEVWIIEDTRTRAEKELVKKLKQWGLSEDGGVLIEWAEAEAEE
jgi:hypothetical protein